MLQDFFIIIGLTIFYILVKGWINELFSKREKKIVYLSDIESEIDEIAALFDNGKWGVDKRKRRFLNKFGCAKYKLTIKK